MSLLSEKKENMYSVIPVFINKKKAPAEIRIRSDSVNLEL